MRRADDLGREMRDALGAPEVGASDGAFLAGLAAGRRRARGRRVLGVAAILLAAGGVALLASVPRGRLAAEPPPMPEVARPEPEILEEPDAVVLLAAAKLRLEGFGDPAVAPVKLRELLRRYPRTRAAAEAAALLMAIERREG